MRKWWIHALVLPAFLGASAALLLPPVGWNLTHRLISLCNPDPITFLWFLAWWPFALAHGLHPLVCRYIWAPVGVNLAWTTCIPSIALLLAPITARWGPFVSYNIAAILSPALSAWACYLLCHALTRRVFPSIFGGWVYGFSSFEFRQLLLHMHLYVTFIPPLLVLAYLSLLRGRLRAQHFVIWTSLLLAFLFGISIEVFATTVAFGLTLLLLEWLLVVVTKRDDSTRGAKAAQQSDRKRAIGLVLAALVLSLIAVAPLLLVMFSHRYPHGGFWSQGAYSVDAANLFIPTRITWLGGALLKPLWRTFAGNMTEEGAYLGIPLLLMIVLFIRRYGLSVRGRLLILAGAALLLAALGPQLRIFGQKLPVPLPWFFIGRLPLLDKALPCRLMLYVTLTIALMGAIWLAESPAPARWKFSLAALAVLFLLPNTPARLWSAKFPTPRFFATTLYRRYIQPDQNVLILPFGYHGWSMLWQQQTGFYFRMVDGWVGPYKPPPFDQSAVIRAFMGHRLPANYPALLKRFVGSTRIRAIVIAHPRDHRLRRLVAPLRIRPDHVGGILLYRLPRSTHRDRHRN